MTDTTFAIHPKTGLPVAPTAEFKVGDLVTERLLGDGYPAVVVAVTPKTVWVQKVQWLGNFNEGDQPGHNGYGDTGTIVVDPESVERAIARGKDGANKYVLYVRPRPTSGSLGDQDLYGGQHHEARWRQPGADYAYLTAGARYRRDPHV